jgi:prephenate dehydrogenase
VTAEGTAPAGRLPEGPVLVVGAGLIGTSVALALSRQGVAVAVEDVDRVNAAVAVSRLPALSAAQQEGEPGLVVVATPPDHLAEAIASALVAHPRAVVTDVGSVKVQPLSELRSSTADTHLSRYVGSHPMAGSERSGPLAAAADLFDGRTWAVTPHEGSDPAAVATVEGLVSGCGAVAVHLTPQEHDLAVARISHLPHLMAALTAGLLRDAPASHLALSGQGVRDVTRIAAGDPVLWRQIVSANAGALGVLLGEVRAEVDGLLAALGSGDSGRVEQVLLSGAAGAAAVPGKHGGPAVDLAAVTVAIPDRPGALAQLFSDVGAFGVNIEDVRIDHDPARPYGLVEIDVAESAGEMLAESLRAGGWAAHR